MHAESIARICHDADRSICAVHGDLTTPGWFALDPIHRENAELGVQIAVATPGATASDLHGLWLRDKRALGWSFGPTFEPDALRDPLVRPWGRLTRLSQSRERLFLAIVRALSDIPHPSEPAR